MFIQKQIILSMEEQNLISEMQDLITQICNEEENGKMQTTLNKLWHGLQNVSYTYGSKEYREACLGGE